MKYKFSFIICFVSMLIIIDRAVHNLRKYKFKSKLKKLTILSIFALLSFASIGQHKKGAVNINLGFHQTDTYKKLFYHSNNTGLGYPTKQFSSTFLDLNILYTRQTKSQKLKVIIGIGINQKGFGENGMVSYNSQNYKFYVSKLKKTYLGIYGGLSYELVSFGKTKIILGQLINPEIDLNNSDLYKKVPLATRTNLNLTWKVANNFSLLLTPYFQTALIKYNKSKQTNISSNYVPYGFGLNFGFAFGQ